MAKLGSTTVYGNLKVMGIAELFGSVLKDGDEVATEDWVLGKNYITSASLPNLSNYPNDINIASGKKYKINGVNLAAADIGAVPTSRTIAGTALTGNISRDTLLGLSSTGILRRSTTNTLVVISGTSSQFVKGDGTLDGSTYLKGINKGETAPKTLTYSGTFQVLGIKTDGTIENFQMTMPAGFTLSSITGTLSVGKGGTGKTTLDSGKYLVGNGTGAVSLKTGAEVLSDIGTGLIKKVDFTNGTLVVEVI